jgi:hypothetical protein
LASAEVIVGGSPVMSPREQALRFGEAWERLPHRPRHSVRLVIATLEGAAHEFVLGAHPPTLAVPDIHLIHDLWIDFKNELPSASVRHRDVVTLAVRRLGRAVGEDERDSIVAEMARLKESESRQDESDGAAAESTATCQLR